MFGERLDFTGAKAFIRDSPNGERVKGGPQTSVWPTQTHDCRAGNRRVYSIPGCWPPPLRETT